MKLKTSTVFRKTNEVYRSKQFRQIVSMGGSRSGKSYAIMQLFCILLMERTNFKITVWRNIKVDCKSTVLEDFKGIIQGDYALYKKFVENKSEGTFTCKETGSRIIFAGADQIGKVLGMYQDISFFNEISEFNELVYDQITQRTAETVFVDYNPSKLFWLDKYERNTNTTYIHSTFLDNPFLTEEIIEKLKSYEPWEPGTYEIVNKKVKHLGPEPVPHKLNTYNKTCHEFNWLVYGLGLQAEKPNRVYKQWGKCSKQGYDELPYQEYFGLDFGLSNPTAMLGVKYDGDRTFFVDERLYKPSQLFRMPIYTYLANNHSYIKDSPFIVADSAKMQMVIDLALGGFTAIGALKGPGSFDRGVSTVQGLNIVFTDTSDNLEMEYSNYSYILDRYGLTTDSVIKKDDHLLDALRYIITYLVIYLDIKV